MRTVTSRSFLRDQAPVLVWMALIFIASSIPSGTFEDVTIFRYDKLIHLVIYGVLGFLMHRALSRQSRFPLLARWAALWSVLFCVLYGVSDEFHQSFVPGRDMSGYDLIANTGGALLSAVIVRFRTGRWGGVD
jgi:VanZ family protein